MCISRGQANESTALKPSDSCVSKLILNKTDDSYSPKSTDFKSHLLGILIAVTGITVSMLQNYSLHYVSTGVINSIFARFFSQLISSVGFVAVTRKYA